jgi:hypothetical protein
MYVCMYVCMYIRMYVCMLLRLHANGNNSRLQILVCVPTCDFIGVCMQVSHMYVNIYVYRNDGMNCVCWHVYMYAYMHVHVSARYIDLRTRRTHTYISIHRTHTHIHVYSPIVSVKACFQTLCKL